jgi:hypothetical protein
MLFQTLPSILHAATKAKSHGKLAIKRLGTMVKRKDYSICKMGYAQDYTSRTNFKDTAYSSCTN